MNPETYDVIIIGGAPAGYTAAIYTSRARLRTLLVAGEKAGGQLMFTTLVENFPGFSMGIQGPDLMAEMQKQAERFGAETRLENVTKLNLKEKVKRVWIGEKEYTAKAVILALGASARMVGAGEERLMGRGVSTCAVCDAAFFRNKITFVVGGGDAAMEDAIALAKFTDKVTVVHRRDSFKASAIMQEKLKANQNIKVMWNTDVTGVVGETKLEKIKIKNNKTNEETEISADGLFLAIGHTPTTDLLKGQVELDSHGYLVTNMTKPGQVNNQEIWLSGYPTQTNMEGVFGAGDMVDIRYRQAITAAGMGCMAALDTEKYLTGQIGSW